MRLRFGRELHYGARFYDPAVGRWWVRDAVDEYHTPYAYVGNKPILAIDPDGEDTWFVHGTWSSSKKGWESHALNSWQKIFNDEKFPRHMLDWDGGNNGLDRFWGGVKLYRQLAASHRSNKGNPINVVAHSHGGNVAIIAINLAVKENPEIVIDNLILVGTPDFDFNKLSPEAQNAVKNFVNVSSDNDLVQTLGSIFTGDRKQPGAINIDATKLLEAQGIDGSFESHMGIQNNTELIKEVGKTKNGG